MTEKRFALIIANNQYEDVDLRQLIAPAQDAKALERVLKDPSIGGFEVKTLLNETKYRVDQETELFFANREHDDLLLLYFSCHGIKDNDGKLYFATSDTKRKLLKSTAVRADFVNEVMEYSRSRRQVLLLDCCYSGAFARGMMAKADKTIGIKERFKGSGRVVLTSSDAMEYSFEGDERMGEGMRSIFTSAIVDGLETGKADMDGDEWISIDELFDYVEKFVRDQVPQQRPEKWFFDAKGKILIARNRNPILHKLEGPIDAGLLHDSALAITAYFELYGCVLDLYTTAYDLLLNIYKAKESPLREEVGYLDLGLGHLDLFPKFKIRLIPFLSVYGDYVADDDKKMIQGYINNLNTLISEAEMLFSVKNYKGLEYKLMDIGDGANQLRGISHKKMKIILMALQGGEDWRGFK